MGLGWPTLCALGGEAAPAPAAGLQVRTGLTWPLKSCSVWANSPVGSSPGPEFCFEVCTPVLGTGCTTKALGFCSEVLPRYSSEPSVSLPVHGGTGVTHMLQRGDSRQIFFLPKSFGDQLIRDPGDHNPRCPSSVHLV